jgi:hypothetical protein
MTKASQSANVRIVTIGSSTIKNFIILFTVSYFVYSYFINPTHKPIKVYDLESCESACELGYQNDIISCYEELTKCTNNCSFEDIECNDKCDNCFSNECSSISNNNELKCFEKCKAKYSI